MGGHRAAGGAGLALEIGVGVELGEELLHGEQAEGHHEGLVTVVAGAEVAGAEGPRQGDLGDLLAVAEDAELGLAGEHLPPADQARLPALESDAVVAEDALLRELRARARPRRGVPIGKGK